MKDPIYTQVEQNVLPNGWRNTKYQRSDGTVFYVAVPQITYTIHGEPVKYGYDEQVEHEMAEKMYQAAGHQSTESA